MIEQNRCILTSKTSLLLLADYNYD